MNLEDKLYKLQIAIAEIEDIKNDLVDLPNSTLIAFDLRSDDGDEEAQNTLYDSVLDICNVLKYDHDLLDDSFYKLVNLVKDMGNMSLEDQLNKLDMADGDIDVVKNDLYNLKDDIFIAIDDVKDQISFDLQNDLYDRAHEFCFTIEAAHDILRDATAKLLKVSDDIKKGLLTQDWRVV